MADRSLLSRATEGTQAPTPGYLYLDISKNAGSSPMACQDIATYLTRRLQSKQNANIKFKCLKVIAKVAESPVTKGQFKRMVAQDSQAMSAIKEALQFRGPPDPARGDEPYQKVRTAAKEALDAIYSDAPTSTEPSYGGSASGIGSGGMRMEGIGNPMFKDPRSEPSRAGMTAETFVKEAGETIVNMIRDPLARSVADPPRHSGSSMPGFGSHSQPGAYPPGRSQLQAQTGYQWNMASNRGPDAVTSAPPPPPAPVHSFNHAGFQRTGASASSGGVGGSWGAPAAAGGGVAAMARQANTLQSPPIQPYGMAMQQHYSAQTTMGQAGTAMQDGQYEKQLVMELCPPGGMKPEPPPDKLQRFAQTIPSLNPDLVCPALLDCLEEGQPWIMRAKALWVMETCITLGVGEDGINRYADFFFECQSEVVPLASHPRAAIKEPAKRVLELLGLDSEEGAIQRTASSPPQFSRPPPPVVAAPPPPPPADLLDFGSDEPAPAQVAATPAPAPATPAPSMGGSLFGELQVRGKTVSEPKPAPVSEKPLEDNFLDAFTTPPAGAPAQSAFGFMQASTAPPKAEPPAASAFGFMQQSAAPPAPSAVTSSFDFMQQPSVASPSPMISVQAGKPTFDPLSQNYQPSPNSQKSVQQPLDSAQLQAMYAHQNMLRMQQQMQQMQIAMRGVGGVGAAANGVGIVPNAMGTNTNNNYNIMAPGGGFAATTSFSFLDVGSTVPKKEEDKKFDFVQDAMKKERK